jgi:hypothetical protein
MSGTWHRLNDFDNPWFFSSVPSTTSRGGGRFDLLTPHGTCYWADSLKGALAEKFLRVPLNVVTEEQVLSLWHHSFALANPPNAADLASGSVRRFGVNAEIHTSLDYSLTRSWAIALRTAGWRGLRYLLRSDPAVRVRGLAIFASAGAAQRAPRGFAGATHIRLDNVVATRILGDMGVAVLPIPTSVRIRPVRIRRR